MSYPLSKIDYGVKDRGLYFFVKIPKIRALDQTFYNSCCQKDL